MRITHRVLAALTGAALALGLSAPAAAERWRVGLEEIKGSVQYQYAEEFGRRLEEKTDGEVTLQLFPYGQLGGLTDIYDAVQGGAIQLAFGSGFLGGTVPESQLFSLNFVLTDDEWLNAQILNDPGFIESEPFVESFRSRGLHPISVVTEGWQVWSANKPIRSPADFDGVAIRVMDNRLLQETYSAYNANPVTIEYGELYSALQLGQADAAIQPIFAHQEMGFYEVQSHFIFARQAQFLATWMGNRDWYDGLSDEMRGIVNEVADEMVRWAHEMQAKLNEERMKIIMEKKPDMQVVELTPEERAVFRERSIPVRDVFGEVTGERGARLLDTLLKQVEMAQ